MVPSSSGLGRLVLIQKIAGSTPAGITNLTNTPKYGVIFCRKRPRGAGRLGRWLAQWASVAASIVPVGLDVVDFGGVVVRFWWGENDDGTVERTHEPRDKIVGFVDTAADTAG